jgi:hypothetical protein
VAPWRRGDAPIFGADQSARRLADHRSGPAAAHAGARQRWTCFPLLGPLASGSVVAFFFSISFLFPFFFSFSLCYFIVLFIFIFLYFLCAFFFPSLISFFLFSFIMWSLIRLSLFYPYLYFIYSFFFLPD